MGWFKKATGIKTPSILKKADDAVNKIPGGWAGAAAIGVGGAGLMGAGPLGGVLGPAGAKIGGALGGAGAAAGGMLGAGGGGISPLMAGALGLGAGKLNYDQISRGLQAHEGSISPFRQDPRSLVMGNMASYFGSPAEQLLGGTLWGGHGSQQWLGPLMGNMAGTNAANQELRPYQNMDLPALAAQNLGPGFDAALNQRSQAIQRAAAARGMNSSGNLFTQLADDATKFTMDAYSQRLGDLERQRQFNYGVGQDIFTGRIGDITRDIDIGGRIGSAFDTGLNNSASARIGMFNNFNDMLTKSWQDQLSLADRVGSLKASRDYARGGVVTGALNSGFGAAGIPFGYGVQGGQG